MFQSKLLILASIALFQTPFGAAGTSVSPSLLIKSVKIIDGTGRAEYGPVDIEIVGNQISRIGPNLKSQARQVLDAAGATVTPGLIDAHTHLPSVPGAVFRGDDASALSAQQLTQMRVYLAAGVTTVLDAAAPASLLSQMRGWRKAKGLPRMRGLAPFLTPADGYMSSPSSRDKPFAGLTAPVKSASEILRRMEAVQQFEPLGPKVTEEFGFGPFKVWRVFSDADRRAIVESAKPFQKPIFVHSEREEEFRNALKLQPYAFMHGGFFDETPSPDVISKIHESGAYVVSTLAVFKMMNLMWNRDLFADPWFKMLVPANQVTTALDPEVTTKVIQAMAVQNKPWYCPEFVARWLSPVFINESANVQQLASSSRAVKIMYDAGIPIVMGADAGNWPLLTTMFHGVGSVLEMEALQDAGLPPLEVLRAATSSAAKMLKVDNEVGTVAEGKIADLLILNSSPIESDAARANRAYRDIRFVIKDGVAKPPREWLR